MIQRLSNLLTFLSATQYSPIWLNRYTQLEKESHRQYFSFRSTFSPSSDDNAKTITFVIEDAKDCSFPTAWPGTTVFVSTDLTTWRRVLSTTYDADNGHLVWTFDRPANDTGGSAYFCYFPPYPYERHLKLISQCAASEGATVRSLGKTLDGREMDCVTVGTGPRVAWVIHRQHPGETMAEYFAEGLLTRILGLGEADGSIDGLARKARELFTFYIVPNMCPDGSVRGYIRTNACGANLNREWCSTGDYKVNVSSLHATHLSVCMQFLPTIASLAPGLNH